MIDIHTHLYFPQYDADRDATIRRAFAGGMTRMVSVGTEPGDWDRALAMTEYDTRIRAAVGIHPKTEAVGSQQLVVGENAETRIQKLRECIIKNRKKIVAIGECGLDYFVRDGGVISSEEKARQRRLFLAQIALAQELRLPLIVHTRPSAGNMDAYESVFDLLPTTDYRLPVILHCYMGDTEVTQRFLELPNIFFSFTGTITYPVKQTLRGTKSDPAEVIAKIPLDRILTETDCPFLAPQSHRGERNEPSYVSEVVARIAAVKRIPPEQAAGQTEKNAALIFDCR